MINFNENEKLIVYHINKTSIDLDIDINRNKQNIACLDKMSICNKQHLSKICGSIHEKLRNTESELKKCVAIKKRVFFIKIYVYQVLSLYLISFGF